jgi:hypothetical protein
VARIFRGSPINSSFSFLSHNRYNFSPVSGGRAFIHFEANARRERRDARYVKQKRARSTSGTKKGFKKHLFKVKKHLFSVFSLESPDALGMHAT